MQTIVKYLAKPKGIRISPRLVGRFPYSGMNFSGPNYVHVAPVANNSQVVMEVIYDHQPKTDRSQRARVDFSAQPQPEVKTPLQKGWIPGNENETFRELDPPPFDDATQDIREDNGSLKEKFMAESAAIEEKNDAKPKTISDRVAEFRRRLQGTIEDPKKDLQDFVADPENFLVLKKPEPWPDLTNPDTGEVGGPRGLEPTRYGDWERNGRCIDF